MSRSPRSDDLTGLAIVSVVAVRDSTIPNTDAVPSVRQHLPLLSC